LLPIILKIEQQQGFSCYVREEARSEKNETHSIDDMKASQWHEDSYMPHYMTHRRLVGKKISKRTDGNAWHEPITDRGINDKYQRGDVCQKMYPFFHPYIFFLFEIMLHRNQRKYTEGGVVEWERDVSPIVQESLSLARVVVSGCSNDVGRAHWHGPCTPKEAE
jgi:hypothetical protein